MIATKSKNIVFSRKVWEQAKRSKKHREFLEDLEDIQSHRDARRESKGQFLSLDELKKELKLDN